MPPPLKQNNIDKALLDQFLRELEDTAEVIEKLLERAQDSQVDLAAHKTELRILCEEVKKLSYIIRGDGGISLITRVAILEQLNRELKEELQELKEEFKEKRAEDKSDRKSLVEVQLADKKGKWEVYSVLATGVIGIISLVVSIVLQNIK